MLENTQKPVVAQREEWIDYLRGLGIILMLIGHASLPEKYLVWVYGFHMPLFFVLSGYLYNKEKWDKLGFWKLFKTRLKNYIVPYFIWCFICFFLNLPMLYSSYKGADFWPAVWQNICWILTSVRVDGTCLPQNCTPLWFLTSIFLSQIFLYWVMKTPKVCQVLFCLLAVGANYWLEKAGTVILPWHFEVSLIATIFMMMGFYIRKYSLLDRLQKKWLVWLLAFASFALILYNGRGGHMEMYYRTFGNHFLFLLSAGMMSFVFMWFAKHVPAVAQRSTIIDYGKYSIIPMGLNYTINRYAKKWFPSIRKFFGRPAKLTLDWPELSLINIILLFFAIQLFKRIVKKHPRWNILIGK